MSKVFPKWTEYVPGLSVVSGGLRAGLGVGKICTKNKCPLEARVKFSERHQKLSGLSDVGRGFVVSVPVAGNVAIGAYDLIKFLVKKILHKQPVNQGSSRTESSRSESSRPDSSRTHNSDSHRSERSERRPQPAPRPQTEEFVDIRALVRNDVNAMNNLVANLDNVSGVSCGKLLVLEWGKNKQELGENSNLAWLTTFCSLEQIAKAEITSGGVEAAFDVINARQYNPDADQDVKDNFTTQWALSNKDLIQFKRNLERTVR